MEHVLFLLAYNNLRKWIKWLPDPETPNGKRKLKRFLLGIWIGALTFALLILSMKPEEKGMYGYLFGRILNIENYQIKFGTVHKGIQFKLENNPSTYVYYFRANEIKDQTKLKNGDSVRIGLRQKFINARKGGIVEEIQSEAIKFGGIQKHIDGENRLRRVEIPIVYSLILVTAYVILKRKKRGEEAT